MRKILLGAALTAAALLAVAPASSAEPIGAGSAYSYGLTASVTDQQLIPPTPEATVDEPTADETNTVVEIPGDPLAVAGVVRAQASVHEASDLESLLEQEEQEVEGPYNARSVGQIVDLEVLVDGVGPDTPLVEADLIRAEAVAVCTGGNVTYAANSEAVNLVVAGEDGLSEPLNELLDQITEGTEPLEPLVDVDLNVVTEGPDGIAVDAVVITVLSAIGEDPLVTIRLGHAEVSGVACGDGGGAEGPQCSNGIDDDGDGLIDEADPDCHTDGDPDDGDDSYDPDDDNEAPTECNDDIDNDGFDDIDEADPDCHTDGDASNPDSYDANIPSEGERNPNVGAAGAGRTSGGALPNTGAGIATGAAAVMGAGALALHALRRRAA